MPEKHEIVAIGVGRNGLIAAATLRARHFSKGPTRRDG